MYQAHKREFFRVLDDIENSSKMEIEFYDKETLYSCIFPMNNYSFTQFQVNISNSKNNDVDDLAAIYDAFSNSNRKLSMITNVPSNIEKNSSEALMFIISLSTLRIKLHLRMKSKNHIGDITDNGQLLINIYEPEQTIETFLHVFERISAFTGNSESFDGAFLVSLPMVRNIQDIIFTQRAHLHKFSFNLDDKGYALGLYKLYKFFSNSEIRITDDNVSYLELGELMVHPNRIEELVYDTSKLYTFIIKLYRKIGLFQKEGKISKKTSHAFYDLYQPFDSIPRPKQVPKIEYI